MWAENDELRNELALAQKQSAQLRGELDLRTCELTETREYQAATGDVLRVISRSHNDLQPVFEVIAATAGRLIRCSTAYVLLSDGGMLFPVAAALEDGSAAPMLPPFPIDPVANLPSRAIVEGKLVHIPDFSRIDLPEQERVVHERFGANAALITPMRRDGECVGLLALTDRAPNHFTHKDIELAQTFCDQAMIAIENARLFEELQAKTRELTEALEYQTATSEVLAVISRSPGDLEPVLDAIVGTARRLCHAERAVIWRIEDDQFRPIAFSGMDSNSIEKIAHHRLPTGDHSVAGQAAARRKAVQVLDAASDPSVSDTQHKLARAGNIHTILAVPLVSDGVPIGCVTLSRTKIEAFSGRQVELITTFADQAAIAVDNARLFEQVQARTRELTESLEYQTATGEVLGVISRSPDDIQPVLDVIAATAARVCQADDTHVYLLEGGEYRMKTCLNPDDEWVSLVSRTPIRPDMRGSVTARAARLLKTVHVPDIAADPEHSEGLLRGQARRTVVAVPLVRDGVAVGVITLNRREVRPFTSRELELLTTFADQAVIATENARLFEEVQARTRELQESLLHQTGSSNILRVIASSPTDVRPVLGEIVKNAHELCAAQDATVVLRDGGDLLFSAHHGPIPIGLGRWPLNRRWTAGRAVLDRVPVHVRDLSQEADEFPDGREMALQMGHRTILSVPMLKNGESIGAIILRRTEVQPFSEKQIGLLQTFADQAVIALGNVHLFEQVQARTAELQASLDDLRRAQDRLVQSEKLASLGQLTAGIAHEIKNPLNFVNNFSALSAELVDELRDLLSSAALDEKTSEDALELMQMLKGNLEKVGQHGKRADSIVKNMLLHSREGIGERRLANVNALVEDSLNLAYHGARAEKPEFNIALNKDLDPHAGEADLYPQEVTRVLLNLLSNGFYAATHRNAVVDGTFEPAIWASTRDLGERVEIRIRDNGLGIPEEARAKMFDPFFTTKPAGEGTGLGLSLSHDIIVKQHGGLIEVESEPGKFAEFTIVLPRAGAGAAATKPS